LVQRAGLNLNREEMEQLRPRYQQLIELIAPLHDPDLPLEEPAAGHTAYGASKLAADVYVQDYAHTYGLRTAVFRMSCIYGEHQFGFEEQGWLAHFTICTVLGRPVTIYGDGKQVRDVLYVRDLVQAFDGWIFGDYPSGVFNIGGGAEQTLSLLELLDLLKRHTGKETVVGYQGWRPKDQKVYISDTQHVRNVLGWKPTVSVTEGVGRLMTWVQANRRLFDDG
jgi:CDP-paratose 2-epimerase